MEAVEAKRIFNDRKRTHILKSAEQKSIAYLVERIPGFVTSDMLTFLGMLGCLLVFGAFTLGAHMHRAYLLLGVLGLGINWFGDSLDGRLAYYRNIPRKWYGFALDVLMDWIGTVFIALGYVVYAQGAFEVSAMVFMALYAWAMLISQLRYKITGNYVIDSGVAGPTEVRILISLILMAEVAFPNSINYFAIAICCALFVVNLLETRKLLKEGDLRDLADKSTK